MYRRRQLPSLNNVFLELPDTLLMILSNHNFLLLQLSSAWQEILGYPPETLINTPFHDLLHPEDRDHVITALRHLGPHQHTTRFAARCRHDNGSYLGLNWSVTAHPQRQLIIASAHNTAVNLAEKGGHIPDAYLDHLTGLPNRGMFLDRLEHTCQRARRRQDFLFAVIQLGIDRFKVINDSLGHRCGDQLLIEIGELLKGCIRPTDMAARLSGDEFAILLEDIRDPAATLRVAQRIQQRLSAPVTLNGHEIHAHASMGIAVSDRATSADEMIRDANSAMQRAKGEGGDRFVVFNRAMYEQAIERLQLEIDLRQAIEQQQFEAWYQPIITLASGELVGFEALLRWRHPQRGLISPLAFIPIAEETGMIIPIGMAVLRAACHQGAAWRRQLPDRPLSISVNLSPRQLNHPHLVGEIAAILDSSGFPPQHLKLEITESSIIDDPEEAIALIQQIKAMQIQLSLDDFGTGYSSLSHLHRLPLDYLKIDRSFISDLESNPTNRSFVETIIQLARQLNLKIICEGIESAAQAAILTTIGCDYGQGFLYARPLPAAEAERFIHHPPPLLHKP
jgi:diguanylate cyclase (GGDEF)-like protein/PAS domain S-box-containing protein